MLRDVFVASINRGQFLLAIVGCVATLIILKMPGADVSRLVFRLVDSMERGSTLGYMLSVALSMGWFWHARWQRRLITLEMHRISRIRTELQGKALGKKLKSSEARP